MGGGGGVSNNSDIYQGLRIGADKSSNSMCAGLSEIHIFNTNVQTINLYFLIKRFCSG